MTAIDTVFFLSAATFGMGPQGRALRLAKGWAARGHPTTVCTLQGDVPPGPRERDLGLEIRALTPHGVEVLKSFRLDAALAVRRHVAAHRPRLVFALETLVDYHVKLGLLGRDEPIVTLLGIDRWKWEPKPVRRLLFRRLARRGSAIIGNSRRCLAGYRRAIGAAAFDAVPSGVLHNPVDPDEFVPRYERPTAGGPFVVGALGRLAEQKGFDVLLEALALLTGPGAPGAPGAPASPADGVRLLIQGSGPERAALEALIDGLDLRASVRLAPHGPTAPFFDAIHALAAPSRWAGFENVVLEAALSGLPCLITPETGLDELADTSALRFAPGTPEGFAGAIAELAALDADARAAVARRQRESLVAQLRVDRVAEELERLLGELRVLG